MLRSLVLEGVGPADRLALDPVAPRVNLITGDNGLGKSFLLEAAWWALTRTWHESEAVPNRPDAKISFAFDGENGPVVATSGWRPEAQEWKRKVGRPPNPGLILYARVDGSFSVWDPARNYRLYKRADGSEAQSPAAYQFTPSEVLWGLKRSARVGGQEQEQTLCLGLMDEWRVWMTAADPRFELLRRLLDVLGPDQEPLVPGELTRPHFDDVRPIPSIRMGYGQDVPLIYAPAGVKRMCMLAYLLAWALSEHERASKMLGRPFSHQVILMIDEPETHLHPRWQRTVLPSLLAAIRQGKEPTERQVQILAATHSPMILASMEPEFDPAQDTLWKLDLVDGAVKLEKDAWSRRGEVGDWLTSDVFDLKVARSREAEHAILAAMAVVREQEPDTDRIRSVTESLQKVLSETDRVWLRWAAYARDHGVDI